MPRDNFNKKIRETLARRVGDRCSNPSCRQLTAGPQVAKDKALNIGVAAHITAAAKGGPRYEPSLTPAQRSNIENGIWLCQNCGKLVDNDPERYRAGLLEAWKQNAEEAAWLEVQGQRPVDSSDVDLLRFFSQCLDRSAFRDPFHCEGSMEAFDQAIEDTITAINTGALYDRKGRMLSQSHGKAFLKSHAWRREMDVIVEMLRAIRLRYQQAVSNGDIHTHPRQHGDVFYAFKDPSLEDWMNHTRAQIVELFSSLCTEAGLPKLEFPRMHFWHRRRPLR